MLIALTLPSFTWPERRFRPAKKAEPMVDDADFTSRANPFARDTDHRKLDAMLYQWSIWIRAGGLEEFDVKAAGFWAHGSSDIQALDDWADNKDAITMNAAIGDLPPIEQCAVSHVHIGAVFRSNRGKSIDECYLDARLHLSEGLRKRRVD